MADDENKAAEPPFQTAAERHPGFLERMEQKARSFTHSGLSVTPGLREVPDSKAPAMADGSAVSHVMGPQQSAVDPIAAGLDLSADSVTRNEGRIITQTGTLGSGSRPATYAEKGLDEPKGTPDDHSEVPAPSDAEADLAPGPNSVEAGELTAKKTDGI